MHNWTDVLNTLKVISTVTIGLWAAWTFHKLQKVRKAELDLEVDAAKIKSEHMVQKETEARLLALQPQLGIDLALTEAPLPSEQAKSCLRVTVTLRNEGTSNLQVEFEGAPLMVGRIVSTGDAKIDHVLPYEHFYLAPKTAKQRRAGYRVFRVGQKRQFDFLIPIPEPGAYFVQFAAWYYRIPFDRETHEDDSKSESTSEAPSIFAYEQKIFLASGGLTR